MASATEPAATGRLASIDALRGVTVAAMLLVNTPGDWGHVYAPLLHAPWHGCTPTDLVFPFFLFVAGVSMAFSLAPRAAQVEQRGHLALGVLKRAARIALAGVLLHLLVWWALDTPHFRLWGVLQRIALCVAVAGVLAVYGRTRLHLIMLAALLGGYTVVLLGADTLAPWHNPASRLDTVLFAPWLYQWQPDTGLGHDPEGLLSSLGAIATTLLGLLAGTLLRQQATRRLLLLAGSAALAGVVLSPVVPWNKQLWTPTYVLWTGGLAALALWAAHWLVDRRGWPALGRRFGVNAIAVYLGAGVLTVLLDASGIWAWMFRESTSSGLVSPSMVSLLMAVAFVSLWWWVARVLDRRGIYVKV